MRHNPQIRFFEGRVRGYMTADLTPERMAIAYRAISDVRDPAATVSTLAAWVVEDGRSGVLAA